MTFVAMSAELLNILWHGAKKPYYSYIISGGKCLFPVSAGAFTLHYPLLKELEPPPQTGPVLMLRTPPPYLFPYRQSEPGLNGVLGVNGGRRGAW